MRNLFYIIFCFLISIVVTGCDALGGKIHEVTGVAYEVKSEIDRYEDTDTLCLILESGYDGDYLFFYEFDGSHRYQLLDMNGNEFISGSSIPLSKNEYIKFVLPRLAIGKNHELSMTFEKDGVSRSYVQDIPSLPIFDIEIERPSDSYYSTVTISATAKQAEDLFTFSILLDEESLNGIKYGGVRYDSVLELDFRKVKSYTLELPYISQGYHSLSFMASSNEESYTMTMDYKEPQSQLTTLNFGYRYNSAEDMGDLYVVSDSHPNKDVEFYLSGTISVIGQLPYRSENGAITTDKYLEREVFSIEFAPQKDTLLLDAGTLQILMDMMHNEKEYSIFRQNGAGVEIHAEIMKINMDFSLRVRGVNESVPTLIRPVAGEDFTVLYKHKFQTWDGVYGSDFDEDKDIRGEYLKPIEVELTVNRRPVPDNVVIL